MQKYGNGEEGCICAAQCTLFVWEGWVNEGKREETRSSVDHIKDFNVPLGKW